MIDPTKFSTKPLAQVAAGSFFILSRPNATELAFMTDLLPSGSSRCSFVVLARNGTLIAPELSSATGSVFGALDLGHSVTLAVTPLSKSVSISETQPPGAGVVCWGNKHGIQATDPKGAGHHIVNIKDGTPLFDDGSLALFEEWDLVTTDDWRRVLGSYRAPAP